MADKHQKLRLLLTDAIIDLCRRETFYIEELRIEGTVCLVSDRSSVVIAQITEQIGENSGKKDSSNANDEPDSLSLVSLHEEFRQDDSARHGQKNEAAVVSNKDRLAEAENVSRRLKRINKALLPMYRTGGKYLCPFCPKKYHFKHSLKDHINTHTGSQPHVCKHCRRTFSHLASLCTHIKRCHYSQISQEFQCEICKERFLNRQSLKQHFTWRHRKGSSDGAAQATASGDAAVDADVGDAQPQEDDAPEENGCPPQEDKTWEKSEQPTKTSVAATTAQFVYQNNDPQDIASNMAVTRHDIDVPEVMSSSSGAAPMATPPSLYSQAPPISLPPMSSPLIDFGQFAHCLMSVPPSSMAQFYHQATAPSSFIPATPPLVMSQSAPLTFERTIDGKFQCPYCVKMYNFKHTLKDHINKHMGKRPHVCKHCGDTFTHLASLCAHIKRRHAEHMSNDYKCEICHNKFMNYQSLKQHHTWRHRDKKPPLLNVSAATDAASTPSMVAPPAHTRAPALSLPSVGAFMSNVLTSSPSPPVLNHAEPLVKIEAPDFDPYTLPTRDLVSTGSDPKALLEVSSVDEQPMDTGGGDNSETNVGQLSPSGSIMSYFEEINYQTEYGLYRYKCRLCSNVFKIKNSLYEHVNSHLGKKPHVCSVCGVAFTHHSSLHNHMRNKHTFHSRQEKEAQCKIQCPTCGRKFRYPSELDRHFNYNPDHDRTGAASRGATAESPEAYLSGDVLQPEKSPPSQPPDCVSK